MLFFLPQNEVHRVGFTATKKIGNAVVRNRAKRRLRALFCEYSKNLQDGTYIFVAKQSLFDAAHTQLNSDFLKVLTRSKSFKVNA